MRAVRSGALTIALAGALFPGAHRAAAQVREDTPLRPGDTVWATPTQRYPAGPLHRAILGDGHRELWAVPVPVEVLDLDAVGGGLTLEGLGGGLQTRSLRFRSADGRRWAFRSLDKDAARTLEPELRETVAARVLQDRISSLLPLSAMVVTPLLDAVGVLHAPPMLRVMPRDPRLGEHLEEFGGLLGWMEERPDEAEGGRAGFGGSSRIVGSDRLLEILEEEPRHHVAAGSYLRARLLDVLVGDWDRHPGQWRWARYGVPGGFIYEPIPRDRDWALAHMDGAVMWLTRTPWPHYMGFGPELGSVFRQTWSGRTLDRSILPLLSREEWERITEEVVAKLDDGVLHDAVSRLPEPYRERIGDDLEAALRTRRDQLPGFARDFRAQVIRWADVFATDADEVVRIRREPGDSVRVELWAVDELGPAPAPYYRGVFSATETREVRLYLRGGNDVVSVEGERTGSVRIRVIGGGGDDRFVDNTRGDRVGFYDDRGQNRFTAAERTQVDERGWRDPIDPATNSHQAGARDWGSRTLPAGRISYGPDWGLVVGLGGTWTRYGFRRWPFDARVETIVGMSSATGRLHGHVALDVPLGVEARVTTTVAARGSEVRRWYGTGNGSVELGDDDGYEAQRREVSGESWVTMPAGALDVAIGARFRRLSDLGNPGTLIDSVRPYGYPHFRQIGLGARIIAEAEGPRHATGVPPRVEVGAMWMPAAFDVVDPFGVLYVQGGASVSLAEEARVPPVLAVHAAARHVIGDAPYHERSFLGGPDDLRGYRNTRFEGRDAVVLNSELRFGLGRAFLLLPFDVGAFALADVGRVFSAEDTSGAWHTGLGGGVWVGFLQQYTATLAVAHGEITALYLGTGFTF